jgi:rhodanese-related sulfurtransferase
MLSNLLKIVLAAMALAVTGPAWSYDTAMAQSYAKLFAPVTGASAGKALHLMKPDAFVNKVKAEEPLTVLDVRTPAETGIFSATLPGTLVIPVDELFTEASLARIPTDRTVVVICKSGTRAAAAGTALRHIGFDNVYILKGGFKALAGYLGPVEASATPKPQAVATPPAPQHAMGWPPVPHHGMGWPPVPAPYAVPRIR